MSTGFHGCRRKGSENMAVQSLHFKLIVIPIWVLFGEVAFSVNCFTAFYEPNMDKINQSIDFILLEQLKLWSPTSTKLAPLKSDILSMNCGHFSQWPRPSRSHGQIENMLTLSCSEFYSEQLLYWTPF